MTTLGEFCFFRCKNLKQIKFEDGIQLDTLQSYLFQANRIEEIVIPASVKELCRYCFNGCEINRLKFEEVSQLTTISEHAFYCSKVKEIQAPDSLKDRLDEVMKGTRAFAGAMASEASKWTNQQKAARGAAPQLGVQPLLQARAWGTGVAFPMPNVTPQPGAQPEGIAVRPVFPLLPGPDVTPLPGVQPEGVDARPVFSVLDTDKQSKDADKQPLVHPQDWGTGLHFPRWI